MWLEAQVRLVNRVHVLKTAYQDIVPCHRPDMLKPRLVALDRFGGGLTPA